MKVNSTFKRILPTLIILICLFGVVRADSAIRTEDISLTFDEFLVPKATFMIDGTPIDLSIDTGSSFAFHLTLPQIEALGVSLSTEKRRTIDAGGNTQENALYVANTLNLNGIDLRNARIVPLQPWGLMLAGKGEPPDTPVIGLGAFADKVLVLDYKNNLMRVADGMPEEWVTGRRFVEYPFILASEGLIFNVEHAGREYRLVLDSGATVSVIWNERLATTDREPCTIVNPEIDIEGCGAVRLSAISRHGARDAFTAVAIDGKFDHMKDIDGLLGNNFLDTRTVIVDFQSRRLWVSRSET